MKKILMMGIAAVASVAMAQEMSLADASGQLDAAVANPATMTSVTKQLSAADQVSFLARANASIDALPGSAAEKASKYLNVNAAALKGAAKGNVPALLAEVFATVPPEALTVINERFAADLFSRTADAAQPVSDAAFAKAAETTMATVEKRMATADNAGVRNTFAALMFLRASNGTPADLADKLVPGLGDAKTQELAKNEWIPPALNDRNYEPMLGASDAGEQPEAAQVLRLAGPQASVALLADLGAGDVVNRPTTSTMFSSSGLYAMPGLSEDWGVNSLPRTLNKDLKYNGTYRRGDGAIDGTEPGPYFGQRTR